MIYGYVTISKDTSDTENQVAEILRYTKAIDKGEYRKEYLSKIADMSLPTFRNFLKENPDIEALRAAKQPNIRRDSGSVS